MDKYLGILVECEEQRCFIDSRFVKAGFINGPFRGSV